MKSLKFLAAASAALAVSVTAVERASAQEKVQVSRTQPNQVMLSSGLVAFGIPYISSVIVAAESAHHGDDNLYVPVVGPWIDIANRGCGGYNNTCNHEGLYKGLLIVDGIFQGVGALQVAGAFLFPETVTVSNAKRRTRKETATVRISPASVGTGYGIAAIGRF